MNKLQQEKKKALQQLKMFEQLQNCLNMDFPKNLNYIYLQNFSTLNSYFENKIFNNLDYTIKTDYTIRTLIYNFVVSVKAYINRKKRKIELTVPAKYKEEVNNIVSRYWKSKRKETTLDKLVYIRDKFEHEEISGISLKRLIYADHIEDRLFFEEINLMDLFKDVLIQLDNMNKDIERYIDLELKKLDFRKNSLFMNAFYKRFKGNECIKVFPEPTVEEVKYYDNYIEKLINDK